jgi:hypothetical protein
MDMQYGLHARQRHYERIQHALGPRPEPYGRVAPASPKRSMSLWPRIAQLARWPTLFIPRVKTSHEH